jgi:hypothetical protein
VARPDVAGRGGRRTAPTRRRAEATTSTRASSEKVAPAPRAWRGINSVDFRFPVEVVDDEHRPFAREASASHDATQGMRSRLRAGRFATTKRAHCFRPIRPATPVEFAYPWKHVESRDDTRLSKAPSGFQAALVALFDLEEVQSFALVEGDDRAALETREAGLVIITSNDQEPRTAHVLVVPLDNVEVVVQYPDPRPDLGWRGQPIPRRTSRLGGQARSTT